MGICYVNGVKQIYDELHGYVNLTPTEEEIVNNPIFQRLRNILQLGLTYYIYPGATHTRFSHSIGVKHVVGKIGEILCKQGLLSSDEIRLLRLAGILHDIGHYPLSHALEGFFLSLGKLGHEKLGNVIIQKTTIGDYLKNEGYEPKEVSDIIMGTHRNKLFNMILSSDVDADRLDYLLRDSMHTGVAYGNIDVERIVNTLTVDDEGNLAILRKGLESIENLYVARLHMYRSVYMHKSVIGFEMLLSKIYSILYEKMGPQEGVYGPRELSEMISSEEFVFFDDHYVFSLIRKFRKDPRLNDVERKLVDMLLYRRPFKIVFNESSFSKEVIREKYLKLRECLKEKLSGTDIEKTTLIYYGEIAFFSRKNAVSIVENVRSKGIPIYSLKGVTLLSFLPTTYAVLRLYTIPKYSTLLKDIANKCFT
mgnify:CR=1 FL=1